MVQLADQLVGLGAGHGKAAQGVARRDHAGHGLDAVARDVPHHEQQVAAGELERVVPVAAHQGARHGGQAPARHVDAGGGHRADALRHDRPLQPQRELVLGRGPLLAVGQQVPGFGKREPGLVEELYGAHVLGPQLHLPFHSAANGEPARLPWLRAITAVTCSFATAGRRRPPSLAARSPTPPWSGRKGQRRRLSRRFPRGRVFAHVERMVFYDHS